MNKLFIKFLLFQSKRKFYFFGVHPFHFSLDLPILAQRNRNLNFLAHYYFDRIDHDPHHNLGLILPDLVRNFVKGTKFKYEAVPESAAAKSLLHGCLAHIKSDKIFHEWEGFLESMDRIIEEIRHADLGLRKDWFIAHIFSELILDHALLKIHPNLAIELYTDYEKVDIAPLEEFLDSQNFNRFDLFLEGYRRFMKHQYLLSYKDEESVLYALGRICTKMRLPAFTDEQIVLFQRIMTKEKDFLVAEVPHLKQALK
jgi:hypothetical protein